MMIKATAVAAVSVLLVSDVRALQPHKPNAPTSRISSTRLDYISLAAAPATEKSTQEQTLQRQEDLQKLEQLLQLEISQQTQTQQAPPLPEKKQRAKKMKKLKKVKETTSSSSSSSSSSSLSDRLQKHKKTIQKQRQQKQQPSSTQHNDVVSLDSVYWIRQSNNNNQNKKKKTALLTKEQEIVLTQQIRALRKAETVRDEYLLATNHSSASEADWAQACGLESSLELRKVIRLGQEARSQLVQSNMGLVVSIAKKHHASLKHAMEAGQGSVGTILTLQDCLQEGQIGLIKAAERFDPSRNVRFGTYATWWIRQRILGAIRDTSRIIRLPAHVHTMLMKMKKAKKQIRQDIGREPSVPELAHYMELPVEKVRQYTHASQNVLSLEKPLRTTAGRSQMDTDSRTLADTIASDAPTPLEDAQRESLRRDLHQVLLEHLTATERAVLMARYGLTDGTAHSLEETARIVGVSRERVRLVESKALNKLRSPQKNYRLQTYVGGGSSSGSKRIPPKTTATATTTKRYQIQENDKASAWTVTDHNSRDVVSPFDYAIKTASPSSTTTSSKKRSKVKLSTRPTRGKPQIKKNALTMGQDYGSKMNHKRSGDETAALPKEEAATPDRLWFF
ncbi:sigma factor SigA [Seminavis robusta]|uniref:Sigma factor SigA n=1 Tax=Seminavis robusta TaxID=568900 RepID=A0A9N8EQF2_9STRA|nr:sigma factor SigA [Seminavis robusta]|eukprot:Sro1407_g270010.1 sigma factor SigA (621) ;mRNA; f:17541-19545